MYINIHWATTVPKTLCGQLGSLIPKCGTWFAPGFGIWAQDLCGTTTCGPTFGIHADEYNEQKCNRTRMHIGIGLTLAANNFCADVPDCFEPTYTS
jgi:hypothetical protein